MYYKYNIKLGNIKQVTGETASTKNNELIDLVVVLLCKWRGPF